MASGRVSFSASSLGRFSVPAASLAIVLQGVGCGDRQRDLAYLPQVMPTAEPSAMPSAPSSIGGIELETIAAVVNERPLGAASLGTGTRGGGTFEDALDAGAWVEVASSSELVSAVSDDAPRIVLIHEGTYDLGEAESYEVQTCPLSCPDGSALATLGTELQPAGKCDDSSALLSVESRRGYLLVGSNKTLLGLGAGAVLRNVQVDVSGSSNVILRNLEIRDVNPGLSGIGSALVLWPSDHVWIDHLSFFTSSHTFINIHSDWEDASPYPVLRHSSQITISYSYFDGASDAHCGAQQVWGIGTQRDPAITLHHNVMRNSNRGFPYLFGPETWGHVFNNVVRDTSAFGVGVVCGARGLIEGNLFSGNALSLHVGDDGAPTWPFCSAGLFGRAWFPYQDAADPRSNALDDASLIRDNDQPLDGSGLDVPTPVGEQYRVSVPLPEGSASYDYPLETPSEAWATQLEASVGVGQLF